MKILYFLKNSSNNSSVIIVFLQLSRSLNCLIMLYCYMDQSWA